MAKIKVIIDVYEEDIKAESGMDHLDEAVDRELGWLYGSGMVVETWDFIDRPSRFQEA